jgi:hypothetical protein
MSVYSYGVASPLKFELSDEYADLYNTAVMAFLDAQTTFKEEYGVNWTPKTPLNVVCDRKAIDAFNAFKPILEAALEHHGSPVMMSDIYDDILVKN